MSLHGGTNISDSDMIYDVLLLYSLFLHVTTGYNNPGAGRLKLESEEQKRGSGVFLSTEREEERGTA